ncbi:hypothetical protein FDP41_012634 [Naegleria fowleri]|uniref:Uncharacterized protein n=1 Tax=Naegleria fowleri TaxID=5763 RepID=A0A6A5BZJ8_NAEFO|nr:uncharacterized protein FDP41_012634 [Naegleria fowleri]KAF0980846.1 hypothetical protein FDP41_012634 [Naegleria fowleri]
MKRNPPPSCTTDAIATTMTQESSPPSLKHVHLVEKIHQEATADDAQSASLNMGSTSLSHGFDEDDDDDDNSSMDSLSSDASASSIGQLYNQRNNHATMMTQNVCADSYSTLPPMQNVFYLGATHLYGNTNNMTSGEYPSVLSLSVQEDPSFLNSFYDDGYCRPFKLRVKINDLSEKLPEGIYTGLVDSMTLLTLTKPYSMLSTKVTVREGTNNEVIGQVSKDLFKRNFSVKSTVSNKILYKIVQEKNNNATMYGSPSTENYSIYEQKEKIGMIMVKKGKEFRLDVPPSLTPEDKALLLSAMILIVFTYYEDAKSQTFFAKNCKKKQYTHYVPPNFNKNEDGGFYGSKNERSTHATCGYQQSKIDDLIPESNRYL